MDSEQIFNIYLLSKVTCLHLQFYISICNLYFRYERISWTVKYGKMWASSKDAWTSLLLPFYFEGSQAFMNYPFPLSLCSRCCRRDSLYICYGGRWWWGRRIFLKNNSEPHFSLFILPSCLIQIHYFNGSFWDIFSSLPTKGDREILKCSFFSFITMVYLTSPRSARIG